MRRTGWNWWKRKQTDLRPSRRKAWKSLTDKERQKVFEAVESGERMTEATVRGLVKGIKKKSKSNELKSESERLKNLKEKIETYKKIIISLQDENKKLTTMLSNRDKINL